MLKTLTLAGVLALAATGANADTLGGGKPDRHGLAMLATCTATDATSLAMCRGYVAAIADVNQTGNGMDGERACIGPEVKLDELVAVAISQLAIEPTMPASDMSAAADLVSMAFANTYVCPVLLGNDE